MLSCQPMRSLCAWRFSRGQKRFSTVMNSMEPATIETSMRIFVVRESITEVFSRRIQAYRSLPYEARRRFSPPRYFNAGYRLVRSISSLGYFLGSGEGFGDVVEIVGRAVYADE